MPMDSPTGASSDVAAGRGPAVGQRASVGDGRTGSVPDGPGPTRATPPAPAQRERGDQVLAHGRAAQPAEVEAGRHAVEHAADVGAELLVGRGVEEELGVGHVLDRRPALLDDAADLGGAVGERPDHLVAHVAGPGLELARHRRLGAVPPGDPLPVVESLGPVDEGHGEHAGRPLAVGPVARCRRAGWCRSRRRATPPPGTRPWGGAGRPGRRRRRSVRS